MNALYSSNSKSYENTLSKTEQHLLSLEKPETFKQNLHGKVSLSRVKAENNHTLSPDEIMHHKKYYM